MGIVGKNIRKIRTVKKLSQAAFAEIFNLARPSVGAYEEERSEPKLETVIQIANYFGISIDSLLTKELTINELYKFNVHVEEGGHIESAPVKKVSIGEDFIKTVLVPAASQLEYIVHINNRDFIAKLPKILIPDYHEKNIRAFEMNADDMHDNFHGINLGDLVFGKKINPPFKYSRGKLYIIVSKEKILIRRIKTTKDQIELYPDNANFGIIKIPKAEVIEAWDVIGYFSIKTDAPTLVSERIMHLENQVDQLNARLLKVENQKNRLQY